MGWIHLRGPEASYLIDLLCVSKHRCLLTVLESLLSDALGGLKSIGKAGKAVTRQLGKTLTAIGESPEKRAQQKLDTALFRPEKTRPHGANPRMENESGVIKTGTGTYKGLILYVTKIGLTLFRI